MKTTKFQISKRNGKFRTIYAPDDELRGFCRALLPIITEETQSQDIFNVQHGFTPGRSPVTNALVHRGFQYTLSMDLENFFDTVTPEHVDKEFRRTELFPDGAARQGLPTSPALANLAAAPMDTAIMELQRRCRHWINFVYTRYADDLTFSTNSMVTVRDLLEQIPQIVAKHGFKINQNKTKIQSAQNGRRNITGVAVDNNIHIPRSVKRKLRAAKHQLDTKLHGRTLKNLIGEQKLRGGSLREILKGKYTGLKEWSKLKTPVSCISPAPTPTISLVPKPQPQNQPFSRKFLQQ